MKTMDRQARIAEIKRQIEQKKVRAKAVKGRESAGKPAAVARADGDGAGAGREDNTATEAEVEPPRAAAEEGAAWPPRRRVCSACSGEAREGRERVSHSSARATNFKIIN